MSLYTKSRVRYTRASAGRRTPGEGGVALARARASEGVLAAQLHEEYEGRCGRGERRARRRDLGADAPRSHGALASHKCQRFVLHVLLLRTSPIAISDFAKGIDTVARIIVMYTIA